jgi:hypothetical protein
MEMLLLHSACGFHALFKNHEIKAALKSPFSPEIRSCPEHQKKVELLISNLVEKPSLTEKIGYLNDLDPESYSLVVHTYMEILESALRNLHPHKNIH